MIEEQTLTLKVTRVCLIRNARGPDSVSFDIEKTFFKPGSPNPTTLVTFVAKVPHRKGEIFIADLGLRMTCSFGVKEEKKKNE